VLLLPGRVQRRRQVEMVRQTDRDRIHGIVRDQVLPVLITRGNSILIRTLVQRLLINVNRGRGFRSLDLGDGFQMGIADATAADDAETDCLRHGRCLLFADGQQSTDT